MAGATQATDAQPVKLQTQLSAASRKIHDTSDRLLQARLVVLFTDKQIYGRAIGCFLHVFSALEAALTRCKDHPEIKPFWATLSGGLFHAKAFEVDCEYYLGPTWKDIIAPGPSTMAYVQHLNDLAESNPTLLLAHAYTQHLALAAGGQVLKRMARKQMSLPEDKGTAIFDYGQASPNALRSAFNEQLNALGDRMTAEQRDKMVDEHVKAFQFNNAIISEFRVGWWPFFRGLVLLLPGFWYLRK